MARVAFGAFGLDGIEFLQRNRLTAFRNDARMKAAELAGFTDSAGVGNSANFVDHVSDVVGYTLRFHLGHQAFL